MEKKRISFKLKCDENLKFYGNVESLKHIIINLLSNSIDAVEFGGIIIIEAKLECDKFLLICQDNGVGIKRSDMENIFNPFFTRKVNGKGTGLGLYVIYNEIKKHGGNIDVESEFGKGTKFIVSIPA